MSEGSRDNPPTNLEFLTPEQRAARAESLLFMANRLIVDLTEDNNAKDIVIEQLGQKLEEAEMTVEEQQKFDSKTGLYTAEAFQFAVEEEVRKEKRKITYGHRPDDKISSNYLIFLDLDNFKQMNHALSNLVVDKKILFPALIQLVNAVRDDEDIIGRHGGDEFLLFIRNVDRKVVEEVAKRIRTNLNTVRVPQTSPYPQLPPWLTASIGIAEYGLDDNYDDVFLQAHAAHMISKNSSEKNQIFFASEDLTK